MFMKENTNTSITSAILATDDVISIVKTLSAFLLSALFNRILKFIGCISGGFQTPIYRFGHPNSVPKLKKN